MVTKDDVEKLNTELGVALSVGISSMLMNGSERILKYLKKKGVTDETIGRIQKQSEELINEVFAEDMDDG